MKIVEAIKIALPVFAEHKDSDWEVLETALISAGVPASLTGKLLEFMPLAFGRVFLDGLGIKFEDYYVRYDAQINRKKEKKLADEPVYTESFWAASQIIARQAAGEAFNAVAFRSSEFLAVNNALNAGSKPEDLITAPPHLLWNSEDSEEPNSSESQKPKKKWQFWK
jgi:hypothetical protein